MTAETSNARGWKDWMRDREQVVGLADHLEQVGWRQDERGDVQCFDQGAAMAAEVIRLVLLPMLDAPPPSAPVGVSDAMLERAWKAAAAACVSVRGGKHTYVAPVSPSDWYAALRPALEDALAQQPAAVDGVMVERAVAGYAAGPWAAFSPEASREAHRERMRAALTAALATQPGGSDNG